MNELIDVCEHNEMLCTGRFRSDGVSTFWICKDDETDADIIDAGLIESTILAMNITEYSINIDEDFNDDA